MPIFTYRLRNADVGLTLEIGDEVFLQGGQAYGSVYLAAISSSTGTVTLRFSEGGVGEYPAAELDWQKMADPANAGARGFCRMIVDENVSYPAGATAEPDAATRLPTAAGMRARTNPLGLDRLVQRVTTAIRNAAEDGCCTVRVQVSNAEQASWGTEICRMLTRRGYRVSWDDNFHVLGSTMLGIDWSANRDETAAPPEE